MSEDKSQLIPERASANKVILHIEDRDDAARLFALMAANAGYKVIHKPSVEEAEEFMKGPEAGTITTIVSDFDLGVGKKDGIQAVNLAQRENRRLPFILASGTTEDALAKYGAKDISELGIDASLPKPFGGSVLSEVLGSLENKYK